MIVGAVSSRIVDTITDTGSLFLAALDVAWISVGSGFLSQNDSDVNKDVKNTVNTDNCSGSMMGVESWVGSRKNR